jgi:hypothetical protein
MDDLILPDETLAVWKADQDLRDCIPRDLGYVAEEQDVKWSTIKMRPFFKTFGSKRFDDVNVVAHSMGKHRQDFERSHKKSPR